MKSKKDDRIGEIRLNKFGSKMTIIEYSHARDVTVEFEQGNKVHTEYKHFKNGNVKSVYDRSVCGVGFLGEGNYKSHEDGVVTDKYDVWRKMLCRCYDIRVHEKYPSYIGCIVTDEWHNFQNFAKWYDENYYEIDNQRIELDKDIIAKNNKVYSPETCVFVPKSINNLFTDRLNKRGKYPVGVSYHKGVGKYRSQCNDENGKRKHLGYYETVDEAFMSYKNFKEKVINNIANEYVNLIPIRLHYAMVNYKVEITD